MENEFIREKIKEKPVNKKRALMKIGFSAVCGLVFGLIACIVFITFSSFYQRINGIKGVDTQSESAGNDLNVVGGNSKGDTSSTEDTTQDTQQQPASYSLSISDYQSIQNELYAVGNLVNQSIVTITSVVSDTDWFNDSYETEGQGSGVIIAETTKKILILTEKKVITEATKVSVTFIDDTSAEATVQKVDPNTGLAVITVEKSALSEDTMNRIAMAEMEDIGSVKNGTIVIALGSPLGTNYSILTGNITSTTNEISTLDANFQVYTTDIVADRNGSGILVNSNGKVIGMVMQDYSTVQAQNTLTAIAVTDISQIINLLCEGEDIPYFGLHVSTVTQKIASVYGLPTGVYIKEVKMDSPAMAVGLQSGDVITEINGVAVANVEQYSTALYNLTPGQTYEVTVKRKGATEYKTLKYQVTVGIMQ